VREYLERFDDDRAYGISHIGCMTIAPAGTR
jgi:hypothetical protein